jgi:hypothetical protein
MTKPLIVLQKAKKDERKPGAKYLRRWRTFNRKTGKWEFRYEYPTAGVTREKKPPDYSAKKKRRKKKAVVAVDPASGKDLAVEAGAEQRAEFTGTVIDLGVDIQRAWRIAMKDIYDGTSGRDLMHYAVREAQQNGLDAIRAPGNPRKGKGTFRTVIDWTKYGQETITLSDDGVGMDAETLRWKFFSLYASGKAEEKGAVGAFGAAKAVELGVAGNMGNWKVHTRNLVVERDELGKIASFRRTRRRKGTELTITAGEHLQWLSKGWAQHDAHLDHNEVTYRYKLPIEMMLPSLLTDLGPKETLEFECRGPGQAGAVDIERVEGLGDNQTAWRLHSEEDDPRWSLSYKRTGKVFFPEGSLVSEHTAGAKTKIEIRYLPGPMVDMQFPSWVTKHISQAPPKVVVRINGMFMFMKHLGGDPLREGCFFFDITTTAKPGEDEQYPLDPGRRSLTRLANRAFIEFQDEYAANPLTVAATNKTWEKRETVASDKVLEEMGGWEKRRFLTGMGPALNIQPSTMREVANIAAMRDVTYDIQSMASEMARRTRSTHEKVGNNPLALVIAAAYEASATGQMTDPSPETREAERFNVASYMEAYLNDRLMLYQHESMEGADFSVSDHMRLALAWDTIVRSVAQAAGVSEHTFERTGFLLQDPEKTSMFEGDTWAMHLSGSENAILVNPFAMPLTTSATAGQWLWQRACHELAHVEVSSHNQAFVAELHRIQEASLPMLRALERMVGQTKAHKEAEGPKEKPASGKEMREAKESSLSVRAYFPEFPDKVIDRLLAFDEPLRDVRREPVLWGSDLEQLYKAWLLAGEPSMTESYHIEHMLRNAGKTEERAIAVGVRIDQLRRDGRRVDVKKVAGQTDGEEYFGARILTGLFRSMSRREQHVKWAERQAARLKAKRKVRHRYDGVFNGGHHA